MGRPRKDVLCVCGDENKLSLRMFLLDMRGYRVTPAGTLAGMWEALGEGTAFDLLLIESPLPLPGLGERDLDGVRKQWPEMKTLVITAKALPNHGWCADAVLGKDNSSAAEVLDRIKVLVSRKRGPKKVSRAIEPDTEEVAA